MQSSTRSNFAPSKETRAPADKAGRVLLANYQAMTHGERLGFATGHQALRLLGSGGQGMVYGGERRGSDQFKLRVALKIFSPEPYPNDSSYLADMARVADIASRVAFIQHDNLVD